MNKTNVTHVPEGFYADEVKKFAGQMIKQLRDNEHKGNCIGNKSRKELPKETTSA